MLLHKNDLRPQKEGQKGGDEPVTIEIDAIQHLGASWAREQLHDSEKLLIHGLVKPSILLNELFVKLADHKAL